MEEPNATSQAAAATESQGADTQSGAQPTATAPTPISERSTEELMTALRTGSFEQVTDPDAETSDQEESETTDDEDEGEENSEEEGDKDHGSEVPDAEETDGRKSEKTEKPEGSKRKQYRHRARDSKEERFFDLLKEGKTPQEATAEVYGETGKPPAKQQTQENEDTETEEQDPFAEHNQRIADAREALKKAREAFDDDAIDKAQEALSDAKTQLALAKDRAERTAESHKQTAEQLLETKLSESEAKAISMFPDLDFDPETSEDDAPELYDAVHDRVAELRKSNPAFFNDPNWPLTIAAEQALILGIQPKSASTAPPAKKTTAPVTSKEAAPQKKSRPVAPASAHAGSASSDTQTPVTVDIERAAAEAKADPMKGLAFLAQHGRKVA